MFFNGRGNRYYLLVFLGLLVFTGLVAGLEELRSSAGLVRSGLLSGREDGLGWVEGPSG